MINYLASCFVGCNIPERERLVYYTIDSCNWPPRVVIVLVTVTVNAEL